MQNRKKDPSISSAVRRQTPDKSRLAEQFVRRKVMRHPVVMFMIDKCELCESAKRDISAAGKGITSFFGPDIIDLSKDRRLAMHVTSFLFASTSLRKLPVVFIGGTCIGGVNEINLMKESGTLSDKIESAVKAKRRLK